MRRLSKPLWHFTCGHCFGKIGHRGTLQPIRHPRIPALGPVVWLTEDPAPDRDDVGLTSVTLGCDRMEYRYRVVRVRGDLLSWGEARRLAPEDVVADLERYAKPGSWWVARGPVAVKLK